MVQTQIGLIKDFRTFANTGKLPAGDPLEAESEAQNPSSPFYILNE